MNHAGDICISILGQVVLWNWDTPLKAVTNEKFLRYRIKIQSTCCGILCHWVMNTVTFTDAEHTSETIAIVCLTHSYNYKFYAVSCVLSMIDTFVQYL